MRTTPVTGERKSALIELVNINKIYFPGRDNELHVLFDISFDVHSGEFLSIVGESGSGKSTLMNIIGVLDTPSSGRYTLSGIDVADQTDDELSKIRNQRIGFVFQNFNLISRSTAIKNVELPMLYAKVPARERTRRARQLLEIVGMSDRMQHQPNELSGGQKQRVAIARAMANNPDIILADEPTGSLDSATGRMVMDIFHELHRKQGKTIILITHSPELAKETERIVMIKDGRIVSIAGGEK